MDPGCGAGCSSSLVDFTPAARPGLRRCAAITTSGTKTPSRTGASLSTTGPPHGGRVQVRGRGREGDWPAHAQSVPFTNTYLSAGEYWLAIQHSSTTATSNSNLTLLSFSKLLQQWPVVTVGSLGGSVTIGSSGVDGMGVGVASAITTSTTMAASVISASTQPWVYFAISAV
jgi:hypothetical protein